MVHCINVSAELTGSEQGDIMKEKEVSYMCKLFNQYEKEIEKLCIENGLDFKKAKMLPKCWGKSDVWLQYHDPNKCKDGLLDETPAPIVLTIILDNGTVRLEKQNLQKNI